MKKVQLKLFVKKATTIFAMASILFLCVQCDTNEVTLEEEALESVKAHYQPFRVVINFDSEILDDDFEDFAEFLQDEIDLIFNDHPHQLITEVVRDWFEDEGWTFNVSPQEAYDWATDGLAETPVIKFGTFSGGHIAILNVDKDGIYKDYEIVYRATDINLYKNFNGSLDEEFLSASHAFRYFLTASILSKTGFVPENGFIQDSDTNMFSAEFFDYNGQEGLHKLGHFDY